MARISYDGEAAAAFEATRHVNAEGLAAWREVIGRYVTARPGARLLDLGSGTGSWARALSGWFPGVDVVAVEPAEAMRARSVFQPVVAGDAEHIPLDDGSVDAVWISTVLHHVPDLPAAARELRRVLRPGAPVLIRTAFAGRHHALTLFRYFPEAVRVLDTYPSVADVEAAFATAGFTTIGFEQVQERTAASLREAVAMLRRDACTPLRLITDEEYAAGVARMRAAMQTEDAAMVDSLDLLVLR